MRCIETSEIMFDFSPAGMINYNMRCIETTPSAPTKADRHDKLQHEMYWNLESRTPSRLTWQDKLQHEMYWNRGGCCVLHGVGADKLQHEMYWNFKNGIPFCVKHFMINYNMRCIETLLRHQTETQDNSINYNMRCIETSIG